MPVFHSLHEHQKQCFCGSFSTPPSCQHARYMYSGAALWSLWAVVTFLCLYASSTQWFKAPCKGLSHPWRLEKKHAPCWGGELISGASTSATAALTQTLAGESLEKCLSARTRQTTSSNTTPTSPDTGELHQRKVYPVDSVILLLAIRTIAALSCINLNLCYFY